MSVDELLLDTAERILAETCTFETIEQSERDGWAPSVWEPLVEAGLPSVGVSEEAGGEGGTLSDALALLRLVGRHAAPVPFAEHGLLAGWLLERAGLRLETTVSTTAPGSAQDTVQLEGSRLTGSVHEVPWARRAESIVVFVEDARGAQVALVDPEEVAIDPHANLAGEPRDSVHFDATPVQALAAVDLTRADLDRRGALTRTQLIAGALERMYELTLGYANERQQFGRPVARFQLVQAHLVHLAQDAALVSLAADAAADAAASGDGQFEIAAAHTLACAAATSATRAAHQTHGAMGMTREYPLHHYSRRLWSWRREFGQEHRWSLEVGRQATDATADALYSLIAR
jgi:acyl-CoA dehydrogenase